MPRRAQKGAGQTSLADTVKKKRHWVPNPQKDFGQENVEPGDNARYLRFARAAMNLEPIDISDEKQVEQRINEYLDFCEQNDMKPGMVGMANWVGVDQTTLSSWKRGEYRGSTHSLVIRRAVMMLESIWESYMQNGKVNPASGIFLGKNHFGYKDQIDIAPVQSNPMGDEVDQKALEARIADLPED